MRDWESSGAVKMERANEHIVDLEQRSVVFFKSAPYKLVGEDDAQTRETVYRWRAVNPPRPIPRIWGAIAGDAIHNLSSALDVLWRHATNPEPTRRDRRRGALFPFQDTPDELKARLAGAKDPTLKAALNIAVEFQPYQTGNEDLWLLHEASISDKHEVPVIVSYVWLLDARFRLTPPNYWGGSDFCLQALARPKAL